MNRKIIRYPVEKVHFLIGGGGGGLTLNFSIHFCLARPHLVLKSEHANLKLHLCIRSNCSRSPNLTIFYIGHSKLIPVSTQVLSKTISAKRASKIYRLPSIDLTHTNINTWVNVRSWTLFSSSTRFLSFILYWPFFTFNVKCNGTVLCYVIQAKELKLSF